jgi:hypothetical protein
MFFPSRTLHDWRVDRRRPQPSARAKAMLLRKRGSR